MPDSILVTGGAGYIGSHMVLMLAEHGFHVVTVDDFSRGFRESVLAGEVIRCDLADRAAVEQLFDEHRFDAVLHFAGYAYVGESFSWPDIYYLNNVIATLHLLEAMSVHRVRGGVFSSSCATFGEPQYLPIDEQHPQHPLSPYGRTKWMVELAAADHYDAFRLRTICLRYFNAAGADPLGRVGNRSTPQTRLIPLAVQTASGRQPSLNVFGRDYPTRDGTCIRDFIHVTDLCQAHLLALRAILTDNPFVSSAYNLGNGEGFSVQEVIAATQEITGRPIPVVESPRREGDPACLIADSQLARRELGWQPTFSDLRTIIAHEWAWEQKICRELNLPV